MIKKRELETYEKERYISQFSEEDDIIRLNKLFRKEWVLTTDAKKNDPYYDDKEKGCVLLIDGEYEDFLTIEGVKYVLEEEAPTLIKYIKG